MKNYTLNESKISEFCEISYNELKAFKMDVENKKGKYYMDWSCESGQWLIDSYKDNYKSFSKRINWINS